MKKYSRRSFIAYAMLLPETIYGSVKNQPLPQVDEGINSYKHWCHQVEAVAGPYLSVIAIGSICHQMNTSAEYAPWTEHFLNLLRSPSSNTNTTSLETLRETYLGQLSDDFHQGRISNINGYLLSSTEVEVSCGIYITENQFKESRKMAHAHVVCMGR